MFLFAFAVGCVDRLPDQDLRILNTIPSAKLSAAILWNEYAADRAAADKKYWGKALEISFRVSSVIPETPARLMFLPERDATNGVEARLLDTGAKAAMDNAKVGEPILLHCFCEGLQGNVILKSCVFAGHSQ